MQSNVSGDRGPETGLVRIGAFGVTAVLNALVPAREEPRTAAAWRLEEDLPPTRDAVLGCGCFEDDPAYPGGRG